MVPYIYMIICLLLSHIPGSIFLRKMALLCLQFIKLLHLIKPHSIKLQRPKYTRTIDCLIMPSQINVSILAITDKSSLKNIIMKLFDVVCPYKTALEISGIKKLLR